MWSDAHRFFANGTNAANYCRRCNETDRTNFLTCHQAKVDSFNASVTQLQKDFIDAGNNQTRRQELRRNYWCVTVRDQMRMAGSCIPVCVLTLRIDNVGDKGQFIRKPAVDYCRMSQNRPVVRIVVNNTSPSLEDVLDFYGCPANCDDLVNQGLQPNIDAYMASTSEPVSAIKDDVSGSTQSSGAVSVVVNGMVVVFVSMMMVVAMNL
jgi:hypothetical protein